jgi:hypothetical protein
MVIQLSDNHMDHTHPLAIDENSVAWTQQLRALDPDLKGTTALIPPGHQVPQGKYAYIETTPGSWALQDGFKYVDEGTNVATVQFALSATGTLAVASGAALDFEKSQSYNVEVSYSDAGNLESEKRVMYVQIFDVNEPPSLTAVEMNEDNLASMNSWYVISQHKDWTTADCGTSNTTPQEHHYCYTGQCVSDGVVVFGDYCNQDDQCAGAAQCEPKIIKRNAFVAADPDVETTLTFVLQDVQYTTGTIGGAPSWTSSAATILSIDATNGALRTTLKTTGANTQLMDVGLNTKFKVMVQVTDQDGALATATGGSATFKSATANKWDKLNSATATVYFKTVATNTFPVFAPATTLSMSLREDAVDGFVMDASTPLQATDADDDDVISWSTFGNCDPTMSDNVDANGVVSLRGDKFAFTATTGFTNQLKLVGNGINFERTSWATRPKVTITATIEDGNGGSALRTIEVTVIDVNEPPRWTLSDAGFSITVNETDPVTTTAFSPDTGGLMNFIATDVDASDTQTYSMHQITAGAVKLPGVFTIDPTTRVISLGQPLNYEEITSYTLTVRVTDRGAVLGRVGTFVWYMLVVLVLRVVHVVHVSACIYMYCMYCMYLHVSACTACICMYLHVCMHIFFYVLLALRIQSILTVS